VEDGVRSTSTETIARGTVRIHGQRAFQVIEDDKDGRSISFESISRSGALQLHRIKDDDATITFNPPVTSPKFVKLGQRAILEGELDFVMASRPIRMTGEYRVEILIAGKEEVRVPAGTFSTVKIQMKLQVSAEYHKGPIDLEISSTGTITSWSAKGVGTVKSSGKSHTEMAGNGRHKVEDSVFKSSLRSYTIAPR
jgi:hypothetical protein